MALVQDRSKLVEAATGKPAPAPVQPLDTAFGAALLSKIGGGQRSTMPTPQIPTYEDWAQSQGLSNAVPVTSAGLSSKGKYGGYYTASDLETAITGEAMARNQQAADYAQSMRDLATKRLGDVAQTYGSQLGALQKMGTQTPKDLLGGIMSPEAAQKEQVLQDWYNEQQSQLGGMKATASQIEQTPMSQYARAIATQRYGMNPALAAGTFGPAYDVAQYKNLLDQQSMEQYGMPYDEYKKQMEAQAAAPSKALAQEQVLRTETDRQALAAVSSQLNMDATGLAKSAGLTPTQLYQATSDQNQYTIAYTDASGNPVQADEKGQLPPGAVPVNRTFSDMAGLVNNDIRNGDYESARQTADSLLYNPDTMVLGRLLAAYINQLLGLSGKVATGLTRQQKIADAGGIGG